MQLREEAVVTPKKVTFVDKEMSRDECIIGLEGFEDEKDADMNRSIRCAAVTLNQSFGVVPRTRLVAAVVVQTSIFIASRKKMLRWLSYHDWCLR